MGQFNNVDSMFRGVSYNKFTTAVLRTAMTKKVAAVTAKIAERRTRVIKLMKEFKITDAVMGDLIIQYMNDQKRGQARMSYSNSVAATPAKPSTDEVTVPAGTIANLITEKGLIDSESGEVKRLNLIVRNLKDKEPVLDTKTHKLIQRAAVHTLTDDEIEYLGF